MLASKIVTTPRLYSAVALRKQLRNFFGSCLTSKKLAFPLLQFYDAAKAGKTPSLEEIEQEELNSVTNISPKIGIDALKFFLNQRQTRLKIGKKLKTAIFNSRFTGLNDKSVLRLVYF